MNVTPKDKLSELQSIISKMTMEVCYQAVLPEVGVRWRDVTKAVRKARLPMTSASVAKILRKHISSTMEPEQVEEIIAVLKIKLVAASGSRNWHAIKLLDLISEQSMVLSRHLTNRVALAARSNIREYNTRVVVHSSKIGDYVFLSLQRVSSSRVGAPLYVAAPADHHVAFVSSLGSTALIKAAVEGLGYKRFMNADLFGHDLTSLLRIMDRSRNIDVDQLADTIDYDPKPVITKHGIDYTSKTYNEQYVASILGPDPPLLNTLSMKSERPFFNPDILNKNISVGLTLKSDNVAETLKSWVSVKAIAPTSDFIKLFHHLKTNNLTYNKEYD